MKKFLMLLGALALVMALGMITGCGESSEGEAAGEAASEAEAAGDATVATHDCDGGCGMKAMTADQTTEIEGKYYCAGCAKKIEEAHEGHDHSSHEGHDHDDG